MTVSVPPNLASAPSLVADNQSLEEFPLQDTNFVRAVETEGHSTVNLGLKPATEHALPKSASRRPKMSLQAIKRPFVRHRKGASSNAIKEKGDLTGQIALSSSDVQGPILPGARSNGIDAAAGPKRGPRRVSFSPSTDEGADPTVLLVTDYNNEEKKTKNGGIRKMFERKAKREKMSHEQMHIPKRRASIEGSMRVVRPEVLPIDTQEETVQNHKSRRRVRSLSFSFDRAGIHPQAVEALKGPTTDKGKTSRPHISRHQAIAAKHARTLERIINADASNEILKSQKSSEPSKSRPIPVVAPKKVHALKKALLDINMANGIIGELRTMQVPIERATHHDHIIAGGPDLFGNQEKVEAVPLRRTDSAAQEALSAFKEEFELEVRDNKKRDRRRLSSSTSDRTPRKSEEKVPVKENVMTTPGPVKAVCLDCDEEEAHRRHVTHLMSKNEGDQTQCSSTSESPLSENKPALGSAALLGAVGAWIAQKTSPAKPDSKTAIEDAVQYANEISLNIAEGDASEAVKDTARLGVAALEVAQPTAGSIAEGLEGQTLGENKANKSGTTDINSSQSLFANFPSLPVLPPPTPGGLAGVSPISLITSPKGMVAAGLADQSGAFDALAQVSGAAIQATQGGEGAMQDIKPPLDRLAIFVHWWGFELTMPKPTMNYLGTAHSISGAFLSFLQTMVVSGGVPELLPFIKYISTFMDMEFSAIKSQDKGKGVIVAATWLMPMALIPRPWDYGTEPPTAPSNPAPAPPKPFPRQSTIPPTFPVVSGPVSLHVTTSQDSESHAKGKVAKRFSPFPRKKGRVIVNPEGTSERMDDDELPLPNIASHREPHSFSTSVDVLDSLVELPEGSVRLATSK